MAGVLFLSTAPAAFASEMAAGIGVPNGGFESGTNGPAGWRLVEGEGTWANTAHAGQRALQVRGHGEDQSQWRSEGLRLMPDGLYRFSFYARRDEGAGGTAVAGPGRINRDFSLDTTWKKYSFVFSQLSDEPGTYLRLGQWHLTGAAFFDDASLVPIDPVHARFAGGLELGAGERIHAGRYRAQVNLGWEGANYHRCLLTNRAGFNSDRWIFSPGSSVVYRHKLAGLEQLSGRLHVTINYYAGGALQVEASRDGRDWLAVGRLTKEKLTGAWELPAALFPASDIMVRLAHAGATGDFQVNRYEYEAALAGTPPDAEGETWFVAIEKQPVNLRVQIQSFRHVGSSPESALPNPELGGRAGGKGQGSVRLGMSAVTAGPLDLRGAVGVDDTRLTSKQWRKIRVPARETCVVDLPYSLDHVGIRELVLRLEDKNGKEVYRGRTTLRLGFLQEQGFGYRLAGLKGLPVWWCESGWAVGRERAVPESAGDQPVVTIAAARGEYEAAQVVLRPEQDTVLKSARVVFPRRGPGLTTPVAVSLNEVSYIRVTRPTDDSAMPGWYPDALPPLQTPLTLRAGLNQPIWLTLFIPPGASSGDQSGRLEIETSAGRLNVPLKVRVFDFTLPRQSHLRSALGMGAGMINQYHHLDDQSQKEMVYEKYLEDFAAHRISPYSFSDYASIAVRFEGEGTNKQASVDFDRFDRAAAKWLDGGRFNSFSLPLMGMGGGTFQSRHLGSLEGFPEGTPEHARLFRDYLGQIETHLRAKGWLQYAYAYWFDEPDPKDYDFVVAGMKRLKAAAPGLKRLLTEQPEPSLIGQVDIWCGLTPEWTRDRVRERRQAGEEVWWYICTGPKAPYVTEFIDHPALERRLWPWQSWQFGISGILIWETLYWNSPLVYVAPAAQDPWSDPMSYVSGYDFPVGHVDYWGNGDGRFLYPPRGGPRPTSAVCLDRPVDSIRWENLRDGMEDYEYFWLLEQEIKRVQNRPEQARLAGEARLLLEVPPDVTSDLTHFTTDPRLLLRHRLRVARMIERLQKQH